MIGRIRHLVALAVGLACLVATLGRVRVDLSGTRGSWSGSPGERRGGPTLLVPPGA